MTLTEIADAIDIRLKKLEKEKGKELGLFWSGAQRAGNRVWIVSISYQGHFSVTKDEALEYLVWLQEGNEGSYAAFWNQTGKRGLP